MGISWRYKFVAIIFAVVQENSVTGNQISLSSFNENLVRILKFLISQNFPAQNLNFLFSNPVPHYSEILSDLLKTASTATVTIQHGKKSHKNFTAQGHRFVSFDWLNIFLVTESMDQLHFQKFTQILLHRARKFMDYTIFFELHTESHNTKSDLLHSPFLEKLKYKVYMEVNRDGEIIFSTICFYCNSGQALRKYVGRFQSNVSSSQAFFERHLQKTQIFPDFTKNFHGRVIRVTGGIGIPLLMNFRQSEGKWYPHGGFMIDPIFFHVKKQMNFSMITRVFNTFGSQLENGSFTGFVNELYHERADIGMAGQSYDRIQAVHFLDPIHIDSVSYATAVPDTGVKWQAIFRAFNWDTWLLFLGICFLVIMPFYLLFEKLNTGVKVPFMKQLRHGIAFIYRPIIEQNLTDDIIPTMDSGRVLMISWLCTVLIISVGYKSKLTSLMVHPEAEVVPNSFEALAQAKYKIILHHVGGALHKNIQSTPSGTFKEIARRLTLEKVMYKCLLKAHLSKRTACISYIHNIIGEVYRNFTDANGVSSLRMAQTNVFMTAGSYMLPKSAVYRDSMNSIVAHQIAFGFGKYAVDKAFKKPLDEGKLWARERPALFKWSKSDRGPRPLNLSHLKAPFVILGLCLVFAAIVFGVERCRNFSHFKRLV